MSVFNKKDEVKDSPPAKKIDPRRDEFAKAALIGLLSSPETTKLTDVVAKSVELADKMIVALGEN